MPDMTAPETRRKVELEAARTLSDEEFTGMCPNHRAEGAYRKAARALGIEEDQVLYSCADEFAGAVAPPSIFSPTDVERCSEPHG